MKAINVYLPCGTKVGEVFHVVPISYPRVEPKNNGTRKFTTAITQIKYQGLIRYVVVHPSLLDTNEYFGILVDDEEARRWAKLGDAERIKRNFPKLLPPK